MDFEIRRQPMISGQGEAQARIYRKVESFPGLPRATYYIPINDPEPGAHIQVDCHDPCSQGYGGAILAFRLEDGSTDKVKGPWHTNSDALFEDTGVDLRNQHLTFVVFARDWNTETNTLIDIVYQDSVPQLGSFDRYKEIAKQFSDEPVLYYYSQSSGGSSTGTLWNRNREART